MGSLDRWEKSDVKPHVLLENTTIISQFLQGAEPGLKNVQFSDGIR